MSIQGCSANSTTAVGQQHSESGIFVGDIGTDTIIFSTLQRLRFKPYDIPPSASKEEGKRELRAIRKEGVIPKIFNYSLISGGGGESAPVATAPGLLVLHATSPTAHCSVGIDTRHL